MMGEYKYLLTPLWTSIGEQKSSMKTGNMLIPDGEKDLFRSYVSG